jgi:8-oxo-dGTP pyrophosphatase MutT (NUDIX family)
LYLVGQYRYPLETYSWEIIEGGAEQGEPPMKAAQRELQEEAGLTARSWRQLGGEIHLSNCHSSEVGYLYVADGLTQVSAAPDPTEVLKIKKVSFEEALRMVMAGEITDSLSIIGILRLAREFDTVQSELE